MELLASSSASIKRGKFWFVFKLNKFDDLIKARARRLDDGDSVLWLLCGDANTGSVLCCSHRMYHP